MTSAQQPDGYLAMPPTGSGNPVLVLHAWWGLNDMVRDFCSRLADAGFVAFAPDLYHGEVTDDKDEADRLSQTLLDDPDKPRAEVAAAASFLTQRIGQPDASLAVIGFSLGAFFALDFSVADTEHVRSVVVFYGTRPGLDFSNSRAAYLGHFAEKDEFESQEEIDALEEALKRAGRPVTFYRYSGTGHWFFEPQRPDVFNEEAAQLAWQRTLEFLRRSEDG